MYKVAIIGAGNISAKFDNPESDKILTYAHAFSVHEEFELVGFFDIEAEAAEDAALKWKCTTFSSIEEAVMSADGICCCVPDLFHTEVLLEIAKYNPLFVITEKPIASSYDDCKVLIQRYSRIPVAVNYSRRYIPQFRQIKKEIKKYGKLLKGVGYYGKGTKHNGSHMIDFVRFIFEHSDIKIYKDNITNVDDYSMKDLTRDLVMVVDDGLFYMIAVDSRYVTVFEMDFFFEKARVRILNGGEEIEIYEVRESLTYKGYKNYFLKERFSVDYNQAMKGLIDNVCDYLDGNSKLLCSLTDAVETLRLSEMVDKDE